MKRYEVFESCAGHLALALLNDNGGVEYLFFEFEWDPKLLLPTLEAYKNGDDPEFWDGKVDNPQEVYDDIRDSVDEIDGWRIVADNNGVYPDMMGTSAKIAFNIKDDIDID